MPVSLVLDSTVVHTYLHSSSYFKSNIPSIVTDSQILGLCDNLMCSYTQYDIPLFSARDFLSLK